MIGSISPQIIRPEIMLYKSQRVWNQNSKLSFTINIERVLSCDVVRQLWFKPRHEKTFDRIRDKPTIAATEPSLSLDADWFLGCILSQCENKSSA